MGSMGVPLYPDDTDTGYALTKARTCRTSRLCTAVRCCIQIFPASQLPMCAICGPRFAGQSGLGQCATAHWRCLLLLFGQFADTADLR